MICSPVWGSRWTSRVGSSSLSRRTAVAALSSSPFDLRLVGERHHRRRQVERADRRSRRCASQRTSPARVSFSFATAPMSPAPSSETGFSSLPSGWPIWPIRSFWWRLDVDRLGVGADRAAVDAEDVDPAGVGVGGRLEDVGDQRPVLVGGDLDRLAVAVERRQRPAHRRRGQVLDQRVEQPVRPQVPGRDAAGDREEVALGDPALQRRDDLVVVDLLALEVALHQLVGVLGDLVHQLLAVLLGAGAELVGDRHPLGAAAARRPRRRRPPCRSGRRRRAPPARRRSGSRWRRRAGRRRPSASRARRRSRRARGRAC